MEYNYRSYPHQIFLFLLFMLFWYVSWSGSGSTIQHFSQKEYGKHHSSDNWALAQDNRGVIYVGNAGSVLMYDASSWQTIPVKQGAYVTSLAADSSGKIFVGSQNEFGYLEPDEQGAFVFRSLLSLLKPGENQFTTVWKTHVVPGKVIFQAEENIFIYDYNKIQVYQPNSSFHLSFVVKDHFYVRERETGLLTLRNHELIPVSGGEIFADIGLFALLEGPEQENTLIAASFDQGLWELHQKDGEFEVEKWQQESEEIFKTSGVYGGIVLNDGKIAFNTLSSGLLIMDQEGNIVNTFDRNSGIATNDIKAVLQDRENNLWLALSNGISQVHYSSPLSFFEASSGLLGNVNAISKYKGKIYAGTSEGLFVAKENMRFDRVGQLKEQIWNLLVVQDRLLVGGNEALYEIKNNIPGRILAGNASVLNYDSTRSVLWVGGASGLILLQKEKDQWRIRKSFDDIRVEINGIQWEQTGNDDLLTLWLGTNYQGVVRLTLDQYFNYFTDYFSSLDGLNEDWTIPFGLEDKTVFGCNSGLLKFIDEATIAESLPDSLKDKEEYTRGYFDRAALFDSVYLSPHHLIKSYNQKTWASIDNHLVLFDHQEREALTQPFLPIEHGKINCIYQDDEGITWIGTDDALIRYGEDRKNYHLDFHVMINSLRTAQDSLLFAGNFFSETPRTISISQPVELTPTLSYQDNSLIFNCAALFFDQPGKTVYSFRLKGKEDAWSKWQNSGRYDIHSLDEGSYALEIKARNIYGKESKLTTYSFTILPPWYRTTWAYGSYLLAFFMVLFGAVKLGNYRLKQKNLKLERIVEERTAEIANKNQLLQEKNTHITHQKQEIVSSIEYAKRIQEAVFPEPEALQQLFPESFVLFTPRDAVSGDFYWFDQIADKDGYDVNLISAVDCTGHGVPGAMVSMIGHNGLNKSIHDHGLTEPAKILDSLDKIVTDTLRQQENPQIRDGMDMGICSLYSRGFSKNRTIEMQYAGANNPVYIIRKGENTLTVNGKKMESKMQEEEYFLFEIKADKQCIGPKEQRKAFTNHSIELREGDAFYLFSDGYADQFGGPKGKKFMYKQLKKLILSLKDNKMADQKKVLRQEFDIWKGKEEQIDDVCMIGVRIVKNS